MYKKTNIDKIKTLMKHLLILIIFCSFFLRSSSQTYFADKCVGIWSGTMYIFAKGHVRDSVAVELNIQKQDNSNTWNWKTSYLSKTMPMVKDYTLKLKDSLSQTYSTDEHNGIELMDYYFNNKLYSVFETHGIMLTSSYELIGDQLIFEVSSGKKIEGKDEVTSYSVLNLQRAIFKRIPKG